MDTNFRRLLTGGIVAITLIVLVLLVLPGSTSAVLDAKYINGFVKDKDTDNGIEATLTVLDPDTGALDSYTIDESSGFYKITEFDGDDIEKGHYIIHASHPDYKSNYIVASRTQGLKNIELEKIDMSAVVQENRSVNINLSIVDDDDAPITSAAVYLIDMDPAHDGVDMFGNPVAHMMKKTTSSSGWVSFPHVVNTTSYQVVVMKGNILSYDVIKPSDADWKWDTHHINREIMFDNDVNNLTLSIEVKTEIEPGVEDVIGDFNAILVFDDMVIPLMDKEDTTSFYLDKGFDDSTYMVYVGAEGYMGQFQDITAKVNAAQSRAVSVPFTLEAYPNGIPTSYVDLVFEDSMNMTEIEVLNIRAPGMGTMFASTMARSMLSGIIREDINMFFGDDKADYIKWFDETLGSDGYTLHDYIILREGGGNYQSFDIDEGSYSKVTDFDYADLDGNIVTEDEYDATVDLTGDAETYTLEFNLYHYRVNITLPSGYEYTSYNENGVIFVDDDENDTTKFAVEGTGSIEVTIRKNEMANIDVDYPNDLVTTDDEYVVMMGDWVEFNASQSSDDIVKWVWTIGGAEYSTTELANYTFVSAGNITVNLTVTDSANQESFWEIFVQVDGSKPVASFEIEDYYMMEDGKMFILQKSADVDLANYTFALNATNTADAAGFGLYNYSWDFGDGKNTLEGRTDDGVNASANHWYSEINLTNVMDVTLDNVTVTGYYYDITLTVWDAAGNPSDPVTKSVFVLDTEKPEAVFSVPDEIMQGDTFMLWGFNSTDNIDIVNYYWSFGDDEHWYNVTDANFTFTGYEKADEYTITLNVTDLRGNYDTHQIVVEIEEPKQFDLEVDAVEVEDQEPDEGDIVEVTVRVYNVGFSDYNNSEAGGYLVLYVDRPGHSSADDLADNAELYNVTLEDIEKDGSFNVTYDWKVTGDGERTIYAVIVDVEGDFDEANNFNSVPLNVAEDEDGISPIMIIVLVALVAVGIGAILYFNSQGPSGKTSSISGVKKSKK